ncbi:hypothetical protein ACMA1I_18825 [Pontibacter sp. 13R65]|uniref:hypothetical protein n=1 Tax=Pontibacter sp. 13R65 TaxID=3127458 RepID=UPI00301DD60D
MKVYLLVTGIMSLSFSALTTSAQNVITSMVSSQYSTEVTASIVTEKKTQDQPLAFYNATATVPGEVITGTRAAKSMSEELSSWVEKKEAVINSYKRPKRRKTSSPVW